MPPIYVRRMQAESTKALADPEPFGSLEGSGRIGSGSHMQMTPLFRPALLLLMLPLLAACGRDQASSPAGAPPPTDVTVVTVKTGPVTLTRELPGRTEPFLVAEVRPQVTGIIQERLFTEGGQVEAGQPLYQLDDASYRAEYNSARAGLARAQAAAELARLNANRTTGLLEANAISRQEYENAVAALREAEAGVAVAEAAVASAEVRLGYSRITAPIAGRIGRSSVTQGALVTANQVTPLATVQQLDPIYVDLTRSSREFLDLRRSLDEGRIQQSDGIPVTILLEDGTTYEHTGTVAFSEVTVNPGTGSFSLRVIVPNPDHLLLPGMYVRAVVSEGVREQALLAPQQGVTRGPDGGTVAMVIGPDGTVIARPLQVSRAIGDQWLVESGLEDGDRVIVEGLQKIRPGMPVNAVEAAPSTDGVSVE